jgi:dolichol-phosphate mannosyltransferase
MVSIVVPVYNEAENLPKLIKAIRGSLDEVEHEVIIVDDNSPDGTRELADKLAEECDGIRVIHRDRKLGVASAIAEGVKQASGDVIGTMNADQLHGVDLLPAMLKQIDGHDIVIASRYVAGGHSEKGCWRRLVSKGAITIARILLPRIRSVKDPISGFFLFKKRVIAEAQLSSKSLSGNVSIGFKFLPQLLVNGSHHSVVEIPFTDEKRTSGKSKFNLADYFAYVGFLLHLMRTSGEFKRIVKFCIVGGSGIGINEGLLFVLTDKLGLLYLISAIFSWETTILSMFIMHEFWTFRDLRRSGASNIVKRALKFNAVRLINLPVNLFILFCLTELLGLHYLVSAAIAITIIVIWNYLASLNLIWRE